MAINHGMDPRIQKSDEILCNLYRVARLKAITFTKTEAAKFVGGRRRLENLVNERKIRSEKIGTQQNARWLCNGEDVLRNAVSI